MLPNKIEDIVSRETIEDVSMYVSLLDRWTRTINLTNRPTEDIDAEYLIREGKALCSCSCNDGAWLDIGSGGGLPGIIVAILLQSRRRVSLIESDSRKCAFLRKVRRELQLSFDIINERAELVSALHAGTISAQALAPLSRLLAITEPLRGPRTEHLFPKGRNWQSEVGVARQSWDFHLESYPSPTHDGAAILQLTDVRRKSDAN